MRKEVFGLFEERLKTESLIYSAFKVEPKGQQPCFCAAGLLIDIFMGEMGEPPETVWVLDYESPLRREFEPAPGVSHRVCEWADISEDELNRIIGENDQVPKDCRNAHMLKVLKRLVHA